MQFPSDPLYSDCVRILKKKVKQPAAQDAFCRWLEATFGTGRIILVKNDLTPHDQRSRLWIICERQEDADSFMKASEGFYGRDPEKEARILAKAEEEGLLEHRDNPPGLGPFIALAAFEPVAQQEALGEIKQAQLDDLAGKFQRKRVWLIRRSLSGFLVMFQSEADRLAAEVDGTSNDITRRLTDLARRYDKLGYFRNALAQVRFGSKEVFDRDYAGNWFNYER